MPRKKKAVALKYNLEQDLAPVVIASGYGEVAERIINIAEERGIPVYRDDSAASMLCMLEVGAAIPEELYQIVATVYVQLMETANRIKEGTSAGAQAPRGPSIRDSVREAVQGAAEGFIGTLAQRQGVVDGDIIELGAQELGTAEAGPTQAIEE